MKKIFIGVLVGMLVFTGYDTIWASVQTDIEKANQAGKTVFLVVTWPGTSGAEKALNIAKQAHESVEKSTVIEMNRADLANSQLVAKYRLSGAPLPLILVIDLNGGISGGLTADQASPEKLVQMIPSPKKVEALQALSDGKAVFVVASRESMPGRTDVLDTCTAACSQMKDRSVLVTIDLDDKKESSFLAQLRATSLSMEPLTYVLNPQGQVTASFSGSVGVTALIQAAAKKVSGCCPGSSKKKCGPGERKGK